MAVALVGPGAIGATIAACLHERGHPLVLCGRSARDALAVVFEDGAATTVPGPVQTAPAAIEHPVPVVFLAVKVTQLEAAAAWLGRLCDPQTVVCVLQNGVEHVELVTPLCGGATVLPSIAWFPAVTHEDGSVHLRAAPRLSLADDDPSRLLAALLEGSRCTVELSDDLNTLIWQKLCVNASAALMVLSRRRMGVFHRDDIATLARAYVEECARVGRAEGARLPADIAETTVADFRRRPVDLGSSMVFDHEAGRPLEWDALNATVIRHARPHGIATPISDVIVPLLAAASA